VRLSLVRLESDEFREHVVNKHPDYGPLLSFIQPPEVRVAVRRGKPLTYEFDYKSGKFTSTQGYTFLRDKKTDRPVLIVAYTFSKAGAVTIACSVQDDQGGERTVVQMLQVE
jgi:hypothetical protein